MANPWPADSPDTLEDICLNFCVDHLETFTIKDNDKLQLLPHISLPIDLCDKLFHVLYKRFRPDTKWLDMFSDPSRSQLSHLNLSKTDITSDQLKGLSVHPISELNFSHCEVNKEFILSCVNNLSKTLRTLKFEGRDTGVLLLDSIEQTLEEAYSDLNADCDRPMYGYDFIFNCPNLRVLSIRDLAFQESSYGHDVLGTMLCPLKKLTHLDLSRCSIELEYMDCLEELKSLLSLNLHGVLISDLQQALKNVCKVKTLRHLDISQEVDENSFVTHTHYKEPQVCLKYIVENLPYLTSLDISGTDLPGIEVPEVSHKLTPSSTHQGDGDQSKCSIDGLEGRHFDFLGLLDCFDAPCKRENLPAKKVTGDADEGQILLSIQRYIDRRHLLGSSLNNLFQLFRYSTVRNHYAALEAILNAINSNVEDKHIQISGSASLFYIVKGEHKERITQKQKRRVVQSLLEAMEAHSSEQTMVRNGCLTFCHLNIPQDVLFCYKRLVHILIAVLGNVNQEEFLQRISIYLLNCLACQVDGDEKQTVGDLGAVEVMLLIIQRKLHAGVCDEILEVAWSTLWNVTDETAKNCVRFMDGHGMDLFLRCLKRFPDKAELLRNMMGLMGNIAEVKDLRAQLMIPDYISVFSNLLASESDGIEVSYNSAGMLAHIISDGPDAWTIECPTRDEVMSRMVEAIQRWPLDSKRNINYRSFLPILSLVNAKNTLASQYWAVWALCNLTRVYPEKYCSLLKKEKGVEILQNVISDKCTLPEIKDLANRVLTLVARYQTNGTGDSIDDNVVVPDRDGEQEDEFDVENDDIMEEDGEASTDEN